MERLHFGAKARRRARLRRTLFVASLISIAAMGLGVPGSDAALRLVASVAGRTGPVQAVTQGVESDRSAVPLRAGLLRHGPKPIPNDESSTPVDESSVSTDESSVSGSVPEPSSPTVAPSASPSPTAPEPTSISGIVYSAAAEFGLSGSYLLSVGICESHLDPGAVNGAGYYGLFQFDQTTWGAYGYGSIYDPVAQARTAARLLAAGQSSRWPNCA